jgi:hypothetical protein
MFCTRRCPREGQPPVFAPVFQIWARSDKLRAPIEVSHEHPDFEFLSRDRPDLREAADIVIRRIGAHAGKLLNPSEVTRADTTHWLRVKPGVEVEKVQARFRAIDWSDLKYVDAAEGRGARAYPSLSMSAIVDEYERCKTEASQRPAAVNICHLEPDKIVEWLMTDPDKAAEVWRALGARLASSMSVLLLAWHGIEIPGDR